MIVKIYAIIRVIVTFIIGVTLLVLIVDYIGCTINDRKYKKEVKK